MAEGEGINQKAYTLHIDTDGSAVMAREGVGTGVGEVGRGGGNGTERDFAQGIGRTVQCANDSLTHTLGTCMVL